MPGDIENPGSMCSYISGGGPTAKVDLKEEDYLIAYREAEGDDFSSVDIDFRTHIIRIYDNRPWKIMSMDRNSRYLEPTILEKE